jgi:hypothetical protein
MSDQTRIPLAGGEIVTPMAYSDEQAIRAALDDGERLVWYGRPRSNWDLSSGSISMGMFGLTIVAGILSMMTMIAIGGNNNWDRGQAVPPFAWHNLAIATALGLAMLPWGGRRLALPFRQWGRAGRTHYLLSNRRAIICEIDARGCRIVRDFPPGVLRGMRVERRPTPGEVRLPGGPHGRLQSPHPRLGVGP